MDKRLIEPDLGKRPHDAGVERTMGASPQALYRSFTTGWEE
jgi:hypothetical protein